MKKGLFLSLDGIDGCGKSTQCGLLAKWLRARGHDVIECRDPGSTALGIQLRQVLLDSTHPRSPTAEALLFMASRAQLIAEVIQPALAHGDVVVSDRFLLSTVVYQGHGKGLDPQMLWEVGRLAADGLEPDLTFVLDLPLEVARARLNRPADRMESLGDDFFRRVREGFRSEASRRPERFHVVNAALELDAVHARITQEVSRVLEKSPGP